MAFTSLLTNLVPGDTNGIADIFVRMVGAAVTYRANVNVNGAQSTGSVFGAAITTTPAVNRVNGPTVHVALATNGSLDPAHDPDAPPGIFDVYLRRSQPLSILAISPSSTTLISRATGATTNAANGGDPSISADGTKVAFTTTSNLDAADTGNDRDVYLRDVNANTTTLVSRPDGVVGQADGSSFASEISNDGGSVVFDSNASNMDDDSGPDVNGVPGRDIYVRRLAANETLTASLVTGSLTQRGNGGEPERLDQLGRQPGGLPHHLGEPRRRRHRHHRGHPRARPDHERHHLGQPGGWAGGRTDGRRWARRRDLRRRRGGALRRSGAGRGARLRWGCRPGLPADPRGRHDAPGLPSDRARHRGLRAARQPVLAHAGRLRRRRQPAAGAAGHERRRALRGVRLGERRHAAGAGLSGPGRSSCATWWPGRRAS